MSNRILAHADNGLVIFCGAGVSMLAPTCLPSWWQMNEQVVQALSRQVEPFCGRERAADWARQINARRDNRRFPPEFQAEIISKHYGPAYFKVLECLDSDEPNDVHLAIAALAGSGHVRAIVTSNFDRLIEVAFNKLGVPLAVHFHERHFENLARSFETSSSRPSHCQLLKLHGSVDDHVTLVDTLAQRMRGLSPAICSCLRHLLRNHYWLFLGYSGADLEGNAQYLCLRSEAERAVGFSWLVRTTAANEPIEAVANLCSLYGDRAETPRGELAGWFLQQFDSLLKGSLPARSAWGNEALERRKEAAAQAVVEHAREWSEALGGVRATLILAEMLEQSISNPQAARELLTMALDAKEQDPHAYAAVANSLANMLNRAGDLDGAMKLAEKALAKVDPGDHKHRVAIFGTMGLIEQERGNYRQALEHFERTYESGVQLQDEDRKSVALHNRAMSLTALGNIEEAMSCYREALEIARGLGDAMAQAQTLNNIGDLLRQQDRYGEAIDALQEAITLRERLGDDRGGAYCLGNIAGAHLRQGKLGEAKSTYERILAIFRSLGDRPSEVTTMFNLGKIAEELSKPDEGEAIYRDALAIATESGLGHERADGLSKLAALYRDANRTAEARPLFDQALAIHRRNEDKSGEADVLNEVGILLWRAGELEPAGKTLQQAIAIREQLKAEAGLCEALGNLGLVLADKGELDKAKELQNRKLAIAERLGARSLIASAHYNIGVLQSRVGEIQKALDSFEAALRLYREVGLRNEVIDILGILGEICGRQGTIGASLQWFDQVIPLATDANQRTGISKRLSNVLQVLLENGYEEPAMKYVQRLEAVGARVKLEKH